MGTKEKLYNKNWFMWLMLIIFAPIGIIIIWKKKKFNSFFRVILSIVFSVYFIAMVSIVNNNTTEIESGVTEKSTENYEESKEIETEESEDYNLESETEESEIEEADLTNESDTLEYNGISYKVEEVDGGNLSGERLANVAVDIGYGDRVYWAFTNEYGQLVNVIADEIILQDDSSEAVNEDGRYYDDEAKVPGTEAANLDEGHVIADSLGGVSNAYNITPQESTLNRYGDQAYMEKAIRDAGGCTNFTATITYADTTTQIPSHYHYEYILNGENIVDDFDNVNPESDQDVTETEESAEDEDTGVVTNNEGTEDLSSVDTNGDGKVTIAEAKAAGYTMPVYSDEWLYQYMDDRDGDGQVGE